MAEVWGMLEEFYGEKKGLSEKCEELLVGIELAALRLSSQPSQALSYVLSAAMPRDRGQFFRLCKGKPENCASLNMQWGKVH